jgi:trehalose-6-phosphate synthase
VAALEGLPKGEYDTKWIGWPGAAFSIESQRQEIARRLAEEYGCIAVFLGQDEATAFYEGFPIPAFGHCCITSQIIRIGFFLHTPFPAYEIFRCHPRRRELVAGMLGANRIGFHAFGYLRHFCSTVQRLLGIETDLTHIRTEEQETKGQVKCSSCWGQVKYRADGLISTTPLLYVV